MDIITDLNDINMVLTDVLNTPVIAFELLPNYLKYALSDYYPEVDQVSIEISLVTLSAKLTFGDMILLSCIDDHRKWSLDRDVVFNNYYFIHGMAGALHYCDSIDVRLFKKISARVFLEHYKARDYIIVDDIPEDMTLDKFFIEDYRNYSASPFVERLDSSRDQAIDEYYENLRRRIFPALANAKKQLIQENTYKKAPAVMCGWR